MSKTFVWALALVLSFIAKLLYFLFRPTLEIVRGFTMMDPLSIGIGLVAIWCPWVVVTLFSQGAVWLGVIVIVIYFSAALWLVLDDI